MRGLALGLVLLVGCGSEGSDVDATDDMDGMDHDGMDGMDDMAVPVCAEDDRADLLAEGDSFSEGAITVTVTTAVPASPEVGMNDWTLDTTGAEGCTLSVTPLMPDHGHGTSIEDVRADGDNRWIMEGVDLIMGGYWVFDLAFDCAGTMTTVPLEVCLDA